MYLPYCTITNGKVLSSRKKTQTPFKTNKKYTHVKSKITTASTQKHVENQNTDPKDAVKKILTSTMKHNKAYKIPGAKSNASKTTSSQIRKNHSTPAVIKQKSNGQGPLVQNKSNRFQFKVSEAKNNRRHSDSQSRNTKATRSILKRKSCLPSLSDEMMLPESETLKMSGHNVRFISPILRNPENQSFRKTPNRLVHRSMRYRVLKTKNSFIYCNLSSYISHDFMYCEFFWIELKLCFLNQILCMMFMNF